jgi:DnaK suppressor protein
MSHITEIQVKQLETALLNSFKKLRQDILETLSHSTHSSHKVLIRQLQNTAPDELVELLSKIEMPAIANTIAKIKSIDAALINIQIGIYGFCADCEKELTFEELLLKPTRERCSECEFKYQKQKYNDYKL